MVLLLDGILVSGFDWFNDRLYAPVIFDNIWNRKFDLKGTAKWIWDRSIFSIIKPSFDVVPVFLKIYTDLHEIVFVIVSGSWALKIVQKQ